jgi:hypothetical protein
MYPIRVDYVIQEDYDENDPILRKIQEFCLGIKIDFHIREFDPIKYYEDRDYIERVPAIQIYERGEYTNTLFPDQRPIPFIREIHDKFETEYFNRLAKQQIWEEKIKYLKRMFFKRASLKTDLLKPKTRM